MADFLVARVEHRFLAADGSWVASGTTVGAKTFETLTAAMQAMAVVAETDLHGIYLVTPKPKGSK